MEVVSRITDRRTGTSGDLRHHAAVLLLRLFTPRHAGLCFLSCAQIIHRSQRSKIGTDTARTALAPRAGRNDRGRLPRYGIANLVAWHERNTAMSLNAMKGRGSARVFGEKIIVCKSAPTNLKTFLVDVWNPVRSGERILRFKNA